MSELPKDQQIGLLHQQVDEARHLVLSLTDGNLAVLKMLGYEGDPSQENRKFSEIVADLLQKKWERKLDNLHHPV